MILLTFQPQIAWHPSTRTFPQDRCWRHATSSVTFGGFGFRTSQLLANSSLCSELDHVAAADSQPIPEFLSSDGRFTNTPCLFMTLARRTPMPRHPSTTSCTGVARIPQPSVTRSHLAWKTSAKAKLPSHRRLAPSTGTSWARQWRGITLFDGRRLTGKSVAHARTERGMVTFHHHCPTQRPGPGPLFGVAPFSAPQADEFVDAVRFRLGSASPPHPSSAPLQRKHAFCYVLAEATLPRTRVSGPLSGSDEQMLLSGSRSADMCRAPTWHANAWVLL